MPKNLVIVESPAKAKTIEGYLGKDYKVTSSYGHVRDLPKGDKAIDIENGFTPTYVIPKDKKEVINTLKKLSKEAEMIFLASDDDREGEAISWHLKSALDLNDDNTRRIVFREITKNAITNALETPRGINLDLVNAQQARRILDRLVGFEISPVLWKKIRGGLSAGRVQSVAVRLVVDREREIDKFEPRNSFKVTAEFLLEGGKKLSADLTKKLDSAEEVVAFLENCKEAAFSIEKLQTKPAKKSPAPPFTTSTLQQEASRKLGYSVGQTMSLAQKLYESGKISYMRTDSLNLSEDALKAAKQEINKEFGTEYAHQRRFKTKSEGAQEAHEAIRPTNFNQKEASGDRREQRLYELIWKRAIASQMAEAQIEKTTATIGISTSDEHFSAHGEVVKFDGFLKVYIESTDEEDEQEARGMLPPLKEGQELQLDQIKSKETFTRHPPRYTEASLVKKLEEMGIGRPSTYAPTISTIQKRGYILKESREGTPRNYQEIVLKDKGIKQETLTEVTGTEKNKLFPTNDAMVVNDFLVAHFPNVIDFSFTARVEKDFDEIANGKQEWQKMIDNFYGKFHARVEDSENIDRQEAGSARLLGEDPKSGKPVYAKLGRYGAYVQIGEAEDEEKPKFASLLKNQFIENVTLEDAMELFKLPREVGFFEDEPMIAAVGRYGPYIRHKSKFYSLGKEDDPMSITEDRSIELITDKRKEDANRIIKEFEENPSVVVLNGRYGPYIKVGKKNVKIPKDKKPEELTLDDCMKLSEAAPAKKGRRGKK